jgi:hypothetical protein
MDSMDYGAFRDLCRHHECAKSGRKIFVMVAQRSSLEIPAIQSVCTEEGASLVGAVFPSLLMDGRFVDKGIIVTCLKAETTARLYFDVDKGDNVPAVRDDIVSWVEQDLADREGALFTIFDVAVPNISTHLDSWYRKLGDWVVYCGVNAGSETFHPSPCLFDNHRIVSSGLLAVLVPDHAGAIIRHGYRAPESVQTATTAANNKIVQIDWLPALPVYKDIVRTDFGIDITTQNFYQYSIHHPFGLLRADGEVLVRIPVEIAPDDGIVCAGEVPNNSILALLDSKTSTDVAQELATALMTANPGLSDPTLVAFYCGGRLHQKGQQAAERELRDLMALTGAEHLYGAVSLGEIGTARSGGYPLFHNAAVVALPWARP